MFLDISFEQVKQGDWELPEFEAQGLILTWVFPLPFLPYSLLVRHKTDLDPIEQPYSRGDCEVLLQKSRMWWWQPFSGMWCQMLCWSWAVLEQEQNCHQLSKWFSLCASGQVSLSFGKLKMDLRSLGGKSVKSQKHPGCVTAPVGKSFLRAVTEWGRACDESSGWGSAPECPRDEAGQFSIHLIGWWAPLLKHLTPILCCLQSSGMVLGCDCHWAAELIKIKRSSLKTLDLNQGCYRIMQFFTISFILCSVHSIYYFAVMWKCKTVLIILNFCSMFPWVLSEKSKYSVGDVVFVCVHLACLFVLLTTLSSLELCNWSPAD